MAAILAGAVLPAVHHAEVVAHRVGEPRRCPTLATLSLVLPTFTTSEPGPEFSSAQLAFAAVASLVMYGIFVVTQTVRHRDFFMPVTAEGVVVAAVGYPHSFVGVLIALLVLLPERDHYCSASVPRTWCSWP